MADENNTKKKKLPQTRQGRLHITKGTILKERNSGQEVPIGVTGRE